MLHFSLHGTTDQKNLQKNINSKRKNSITTKIKSAKMETEIVNEIIEEPTGCVCCGISTGGFTVCVDCGVEMFIAGNQGNPIKHCKENNPERFKSIMAWHNSQTQNLQK